MKTLTILVLALVAGSPLAGLTFDLKTKVEQKAPLAPLKAGTEFALVQAGHFLLDAGEDWTIWLKDRQVTTNGTRTTVRVLVKVTETSAIFEKPSLAEAWVTYSYDRQAPSLLSTDEAATKFLRKKLQNLGTEAWEEGRVGGAAVTKVILELVRGLR